MLKGFSTIMLSSSLALSLLGATSVKTLANPVLNSNSNQTPIENPCPGGALDCVITVQDGNCFIQTFYWRSRPRRIKRYCPGNNGNSNTSNNGNNPDGEIEKPPIME